MAPEFATRRGRAGYLVRYREYLCPVTGLRVDSEIIADGAEALHDIVLTSRPASLVARRPQVTQTPGRPSGPRRG